MITQQQALEALDFLHPMRADNTPEMQRFNVLRQYIEQGAQPGADAMLPVARITDIGPGLHPEISLIWYVMTDNLEAGGIVVDALLYVQPVAVQHPQQEQSK